MNNESKNLGKNKRSIIQAKAGIVITSTRTSKQNSSLEHRDDTSSNYRISKQRISKQPSNSHLRPLQHSPLLGNSKVSPEFNNKENGFRQQLAAKTLKYQKSKKRPGTVEFPHCGRGQYQTSQFQHSQCFHTKAPEENYRQVFYNLKLQHQIPRNYQTEHPRNHRFRCYYCSNQDPHFIQDLEGEDILCCVQCGKKLKSQGHKLEDIQSVKTEKNYEIDELIQKFLKMSNTLSKCIDNIGQHERSVITELQNQLGEHDNYYDNLCEVIIKKKQETHSMISTSIDKAVVNFTETRARLYNKRVELQKHKQRVLSHRANVDKWTDQEFRTYIDEHEARIPSDERLTQCSIDTWKLNVGEVKEFERDFEKYVIGVRENAERQVEKQIQKLGVSEQVFNQLLCEEELEWGQRPAKKGTGGASEMYFSFERHNSIIYENAEEHISSPGFKQI